MGIGWRRDGRGRMPEDAERLYPYASRVGKKPQNVVSARGREAVIPSGRGGARLSILDGQMTAA
jgi:hypothetical protein